MIFQLNGGVKWSHIGSQLILKHGFYVTVDSQKLHVRWWPCAEGVALYGRTGVRWEMNSGQDGPCTDGRRNHFQDVYSISQSAE